MRNDARRPNKPFVHYFLIAMAGLSLVTGCGAIPPKITLDICVNDDAGMSGFESALEYFSHQNGFTFVDESHQTKQVIELINHEEDIQPIIGSKTFSVLDGEEVQIMASNVGLVEHQLVFSIFYGELSHYDELLTTIQDNWQVKEVLYSNGVLPDTTCGDSIS